MKNEEIKRRKEKIEMDFERAITGRMTKEEEDKDGYI